MVKPSVDALPFRKVKSSPDTGSNYNPIQYRFKYICFETHSSADTVEYETTHCTSHSHASVYPSIIAKYSLTTGNIMTGPLNIKRQLPHRMNYGFILQRVYSGIRVRCLLGELLHPLKSRRYYALSRGRVWNLWF